jgi:hypothetical protein
MEAGRAITGDQWAAVVSNIDHPAHGLLGIVVRDCVEQRDLFLVAPVSTLVGTVHSSRSGIEIGGLRHDEV